MIRWIRRHKILSFLIVLALFVFLNNTNLISPEADGSPYLLAHRGMAQTYTMEGIASDTCTAERIYTPEHGYLENTIASMEAAFRAGADTVEFDVHQTKDNQFAVFHDWTLDCRTNVKGTTKDYTMAELKNVDIGYGYTADGGRTYPFRGQGIGLMPSLTEVLSRFPDKSFLIDVKSSDPEEGNLLASFLSRLPEERQQLLAVYGGDEPIAALKERMPRMRVMSKATIKRCLVRYVAVGWTGYVPQACRHTQLHVPDKIAPYLWGWSGKFVDRMNDAGTRVVLVGGDGSDFSSGFDTLDDLKRIPPAYKGWIWTNRIDRLAPEYRREAGGGRS